jgi:hypothetical protein
MQKSPILLFANVHMVMKADRLLHNHDIFCRVMPVPENISTECGMCLIVEYETLDLCRILLEKQSISFEIFDNRSSLDLNSSVPG